MRALSRRVPAVIGECRLALIGECRTVERSPGVERFGEASCLTESAAIGVFEGRNFVLRKLKLRVTVRGTSKS